MRKAVTTGSQYICVFSRQSSHLSRSFMASFWIGGIERLPWRGKKRWILNRKRDEKRCHVYTHTWGPPKKGWAGSSNIAPNELPWGSFQVQVWRDVFWEVEKRGFLPWLACASDWFAAFFALLTSSSSLLFGKGPTEADFCVENHRKLPSPS